MNDGTGNHLSSSASSSVIGGGGGAAAVDPSVIELIRAQNETITLLRQHLEATGSKYVSQHAAIKSDQESLHSKLRETYSELKEKQEEVSRLRQAFADVSSAGAGGAATATGTPAENHAQALSLSSSSFRNDDPLNVSSGAPLLPKWLVRSKAEEECEVRFGYGLSDRWRARKEEWCVMLPDGDGKHLNPGESEEQAWSSTRYPPRSSIHCYPYQQEHKKEGKRKSQDMFCEGRNVFIDFSKVKGSHGKAKPPLGQQYLEFASGATFATCQQTSRWDDHKLMPHASRQLSRGRFTSTAGSKLPREGSYKIAKGDTYLLARDEDCENMFHSSADHMNLFNVARILGLDFEALQVVLFDRHFDGPFFDLIQTAFSPAKPLKRVGDFGGGVVLFERVVWHLESPAGIVFPKVGGPTGLMRCKSTGLWTEYKQHVLKSFGLLDVLPPPIPTVLLSYRRRSDKKNVGRVFQNEKVLEDVLKEGNLVRFQAIDLGSVPFRQQLTLVRNANIFVGAHGAGLMHVMFMADEGVLVEIHPSYRLDRHFRLASRMTGKVYLPMRSTDPVSCRGSSDAIPVDPSEFRRVMDAAVRIARQFDDGASECGLKCDPRILALDKGNDPFYAALGQRKAAPLNTKFPCH